MKTKIFTFSGNKESYFKLEKILQNKEPVQIDFPYNDYYEFPKKLKKLITKCREKVNLYIDNHYDIQKVIDSCSDASPLKVYNLVLEEGSYNVMNLRTKDWVNIRGKNTDREKYRIFARRPDGSKDCGFYQTILFQSTSELENLTITCKNMRYPIHNDACPIGTEQKIINCHIEHLGNWVSDGSRMAEIDECGWTSCHAHGCGTSSGMRVYIEGCTLIARKNGMALYAHNNANFSERSKVFCINSNIIQADGGPAVFMASLGSQKKDICYLYNNHINGPIVIEDSPWLGMEKDNHSEWLIRGKGNSYSFFFNGISKKEGVQYEYGKLDHYKKLKNDCGNLIKKGMLCCFENNSNQIRIMDGKDDVKTFAGIATEDIQSGKFGYLQYCGGICEDDVFFENNKSIYEGNLKESSNNEGVLADGNENILLKSTVRWNCGNYKVSIYKISEQVNKN